MLKWLAFFSFYEKKGIRAKDTFQEKMCPWHKVNKNSTEIKKQG